MECLFNYLGIKIPLRMGTKNPVTNQPSPPYLSMYNNYFSTACTFLYLRVDYGNIQYVLYMYGSRLELGLDREFGCKYLPTKSTSRI